MQNRMPVQFHYHAGNVAEHACHQGCRASGFTAQLVEAAMHLRLQSNQKTQRC